MQRPGFLHLAFNLSVISGSCCKRPHVSCQIVILSVLPANPQKVEHLLLAFPAVLHVVNIAVRLTWKPQS